MPLHLSVSATTRAPRPKEVDGGDYHFWTREQFEAGMAAGAFLEFAEVHGNLYGTLRSEVDAYRNRGVGVILDVDVQGAAAVRRLIPECLSIFLCTSSWEAYEQRLRQRGTEDDAAIARRLATARRELEHKGEFDHVVLNDNLDAAVARVRALIQAAWHRTGSAPTQTNERGQSCSTT
jgi:guanylate kinase